MRSLLLLFLLLVTISAIILDDVDDDGGGDSKRNYTSSHGRLSQGLKPGGGPPVKPPRPPTPPRPTKAPKPRPTLPPRVPAQTPPRPTPKPPGQATKPTRLPGQPTRTTRLPGQPRGTTRNSGQSTGITRFPGGSSQRPTWFPEVTWPSDFPWPQGPTLAPEQTWPPEPNSPEPTLAPEPNPPEPTEAPEPNSPEPTWPPEPNFPESTWPSEPIVTQSTESSGPNGEGCESGWLRFERSNGIWCIWIGHTGADGISQQQAETYCTRLGATLTGYQNDHERMTVANTALRYVSFFGQTIGGLWLGATNNDGCKAVSCGPYNTFRWTDGYTTGVAGFKWGNGEPDNVDWEGPTSCIQQFIIAPNWVLGPEDSADWKTSFTHGDLDKYRCGQPAQPVTRLYACGKSGFANGDE